MECMVEIKFPWKISGLHLCYKSIRYCELLCKSYLWFDLPMFSVPSRKFSQPIIKHQWYWQVYSISGVVGWNEYPAGCKIKGEILQIWQIWQIQRPKNLYFNFKYNVKNMLAIFSGFILDTNPTLSQIPLTPQSNSSPVGLVRLSLLPPRGHSTLVAGSSRASLV
jgi:hypothetical protein